MPKQKTLEVHVPLVFEGKEFVMVSYHDNYADEFDVEGFVVFSTDEWEQWKKNVPAKNITANFGTNEYNNYGSKKEFLRCFTVKHITVAEAEVLFKVLGRKTVKCFDWDGKNHGRIEHHIVVDFGMFPTNVGESDNE